MTDDPIRLFLAAALISFGLLYLALLNLRDYRRQRDGTWHAVTGRMRRRTTSGWQYRAMTPDEAHDEATDRS